MRTWTAFLATLLLSTGCSNMKSEAPETEVVVMRMIHGGHLASETYSVARIRELVIAVDPDAVLCEIPPDRLELALGQQRESGEIT